jgi:hypothetical protein
MSQSRRSSSTTQYVISDDHLECSSALAPCDRSNRSVKQIKIDSETIDLLQELCQMGLTLHDVVQQQRELHRNINNDLR